VDAVVLSTSESGAWDVIEELNALAGNETTPA
jgi:hypothetical protein